MIPTRPIGDDFHVFFMQVDIILSQVLLSFFFGTVPPRRKVDRTHRPSECPGFRSEGMDQFAPNMKHA